MTSKRTISCSEAINNAIGLYYENRARITSERSLVLEERFRYCPEQLGTRSGLVFGFITALTLAVLAKLEELSNPELCGSVCCASAAEAIQRIGNAYLIDIFTVVGSPAFTNTQLVTTIIPGLVVGYTNALAAVVLQSNCDTPCDSGCGCKTKSRK